MQIITPSEADGRGPVLITGSEDKTVKMWSLSSGEHFFTCYLVSYALCIGVIDYSQYLSFFSSKCLFFGLGNGSIIELFFEDLIKFSNPGYLKYLITGEIKESSSKVYMLQTSRLLKRYKSRLLQVCPDLVLLGEYDPQLVSFLTEHIDDLYTKMYTICVANKTALQAAISSNNVSFVRFVLKCWVKCLNSSECRIEMYNHPSEWLLKNVCYSIPTTETKANINGKYIL
jgi:WD40 repeat protein